MLTHRQTYYLPAILLLCIAIAAFSIGRFDVNEFDEARNGMNAYEMFHNRDYFNLYFAGKPDTWNAKPPLLTWCIVLCYRIFGYGELALRLPAFLFTLGFFVVYYKLVGRLSDQLTALVGCFTLLSSKAIVWCHVGITGDFDALMLCCFSFLPHQLIILSGTRKIIADRLYLLQVFSRGWLFTPRQWLLFYTYPAFYSTFHTAENGNRY